MPINCAMIRRYSARTAKVSQLCMRPGSLRGLVAGRLAVSVGRRRVEVGSVVRPWWLDQHFPAWRLDLHWPAWPSVVAMVR